MDQFYRRRRTAAAAAATGLVIEKRRLFRYSAIPQRIFNPHQCDFACCNEGAVLGLGRVVGVSVSIRGQFFMRPPEHPHPSMTGSD
jgi:hypothetical protein